MPLVSPLELEYTEAAVSDYLGQFPSLQETLVQDVTFVNDPRFESLYLSIFNLFPCHSHLLLYLFLLLQGEMPDAFIELMSEECAVYMFLCICDTVSYWLFSQGAEEKLFRVLSVRCQETGYLIWLFYLLLLLLSMQAEFAPCIFTFEEVINLAWQHFMATLNMFDLTTASEVLRLIE